jgi:hypothetical protein
MEKSQNPLWQHIEQVPRKIEPSRVKLYDSVGVSQYDRLVKMSRAWILAGVSEIRFVRRVDR